MGKKPSADGDASSGVAKKKKKRDQGEAVADAGVQDTGKKRQRDAAPAAVSATSTGKKRQRDAASAAVSASPAGQKRRTDAVATGSASGKKAKGSRDAAAVEAPKPAKPDVFQSELRVFVSNIPKSIDEATLRRDFEECGAIANLKLLMDGHTEESRGLAFITFKDEAGFNAALAYEGDDYGGQTLRVRKADAKGSAPKGRDLGPKPEGCNSVVVKKLAPQVVDADLHEFFKACGSGPVHVGVLYDKATGKSRCTARVDFEDEAAVDEAVKLAGSSLKGQGFVMSYCKPRAW